MFRLVREGAKGIAEKLLATLAVRGRKSEQKRIEDENDDEDEAGKGVKGLGCEVPNAIRRYSRLQICVTRHNGR